VSGSHRGRPSSDAPAARAVAFALTIGSDQQPSDCTSALQAAAKRAASAQLGLLMLHKIIGALSQTSTYEASHRAAP